MLYCKKKTDGLSADAQIRLIPPKTLKPASVGKAAIKPVMQSSVTSPKTEVTQTIQQQKPVEKTIQNESQSTNLVNMLLSQPTENQSQSVLPKPTIQEKLSDSSTSTPVTMELEKNTIEVTRQTIPVSNEKKYEEIEKQNPFVKTLKNKFNLKV